MFASLCFGADAKPGPRGSILPSSFSGWQKGASRASSDPAQADAANAGLLGEYGFRDFEQATYAREGRTLEVRAARFADASGAYGAFTFYKQPQMLIEKIGDQGASSNTEVLFYRANVLVRAKLELVTAMSAADLRELAASLPRPQSAERNLPILPTYLPRQSYVENSARYVLGPLGLAAIGAPLTAAEVDFTKGAEVALGKYRTSEGTADLVLISYPTPQIAGERLRTLEAAHPAGAESRWFLRRTGPMLVVATGRISAAEARSLTASVNYDANVTWNEPTFLSKRDNVGNLIVAALALCGIVLLLALGAGIAFGGIRLLVKRFFPGRFFDRSQDVEIIRLDLADYREKRVQG